MCSTAPRSVLFHFVQFHKLKKQKHEPRIGAAFLFHVYFYSDVIIRERCASRSHCRCCLRRLKVWIIKVNNQWVIRTYSDVCAYLCARFYRIKQTNPINVIRINKKRQPLSQWQCTLFKFNKRNVHVVQKWMFSLISGRFFHLFFPFLLLLRVFPFFHPTFCCKYKFLETMYV